MKIKNDTGPTLEPCPFCGRSDRLKTIFDQGWRVACACGATKQQRGFEVRNGIAESTSDGYAQRRSAHKAWNRRKAAQ